MVVSTLIGAAARRLLRQVPLEGPHRRQGRAGVHHLPRRDADHRRAARSSSCCGSPSAIRDFVRLQTPPANAMDVYVTGKQWMWKFAYPEGPNGVNVLRVPAHRPVRLLMTSRDVIHSFFVPAFRIKQDVLPGPLHRDLVRGDRAGPLPGLLRRVLRHRPLDDARRGRRHGAGRVRRVVRRRSARSRARASRTAPRPRSRIAIRTRPWSRWAASSPSRARLPRATPSTARRTSARPGSTCTCATRRCRTATRMIADEAYITESMMDPQAKQVHGLPARDADLPGPPRRPGVGGDRRVHQVAAPDAPSRCVTRAAVRRQDRPDRRARHGSTKCAPEECSERPDDCAGDPVEPKNYLNGETGDPSWLLTRDHKRIGLMFLVASRVALFLGGVFALLIRIELLTPGCDDHDGA